MLPPSRRSSHSAGALIVLLQAQRAASARIVPLEENVPVSLNLLSGWVDGSWNEPACPMSAEICLDCQQDSDVCLQSRSHWGPSYTCSQSTDYCTSYWWKKDVLECCPASCEASGADLYAAPCTLEVYTPDRFGFSLDRARRMASFANAAYYGPVPEIEQWTCGACNASGVEVEGRVNRISTTSRGTDPHDNFALVAKLPAPRGAEPAVAAAPLAARENDECRADVEWAFSTGRHLGQDFANAAYGHMVEFAGVAYDNATLEDFQRFFFCGEAHVRCGAPPATCTKSPCNVCPVNPRPFTAGGCMVAFRGSNNLANFLMDAEAWMVPMSQQENEKACEGCKIEHGFHAVWTGLAPFILAALEVLGCGPDQPTNNIFVTGHSLGASVATVATAHLHNEGFHIKSAFFFESPRAGNKAFKNWFNREMEGREVFRTSHRADLVPDTPWTWMGFEHVGKEVFFESDDATDYKVCEDDYECEHFKPRIRASVADHCDLAVVPGGDMCFAEVWVNHNVSDIWASSNVSALGFATPNLNANYVGAQLK